MIMLEEKKNPAFPKGVVENGMNNLPGIIK